MKVFKLNHQESGKNYEIEFLRALSVLFVVFFHFDLFKFKGGFIGVDIFFVISGYLITSIILKSKNFNLLEFYLKRIRRIFPIILLTVLISLIIGGIILSPIHFSRLINSSLFSIFGASNLFFFSEAGYFDHEKLFKPLLHTWSLAVEIQFYLIWPLLILVIQKLIKSNYIFFFILIFIFSILLSTLYSPRTNSFFYFTGFRLYEFAIGSVLFFLMPTKKPDKSIIYFIFGLFLIFFSILYFDSEFNFPGAYALIPCLGASLIIYSKFSSTKKFGEILKCNLFKFLGTTSYTIYMLHWPFLIFYSYQRMGSVSYLEKIILISFVLLSSTLVYKYFEQPFRYYKKKRDFNFNFLLLGIFLFLFTILSVLNFININNDNFSSSSFYKNKVINTTLEGNKKRNIVESKILQRQQNKGIYFEGEENKKKIMLLGNSHAFDFYMALNSITSIKNEYNIDYINFDYLHCFRSKNFNDRIIEYFNFKILKRKNICLDAFKNENFKILNSVDNLILGSRWPAETDFKQLIRFFKRFDKNVIIIGNAQEFYDVPTLYFKRGNNINNFAKNFNKDIFKVNEKIKLAAKQTQIHFFDKSLLNCNLKCVVFSGNTLLYSDRDHWSYDGFEYFGKRIYLSDFNKLLR